MLTNGSVVTGGFSEKTPTIWDSFAQTSFTAIFSNPNGMQTARSETWYAQYGKIWC